jgi:hypothetical protein
MMVSETQHYKVMKNEKTPVDCGEKSNKQRKGPWKTPIFNRMTEEEAGKKEAVKCSRERSTKLGTEKYIFH